LNLLPSDGHARAVEQAYLLTQRDEPRAYIFDGRPVVLAEISNRFVVGGQLSQKPDHFQVAAGFALQGSGAKLVGIGSGVISGLNSTSQIRRLAAVEGDNANDDRYSKRSGW
jgi:hypothetical protein